MKEFIIAELQLLISSSSTLLFLTYSNDATHQNITPSRSRRWASVSPRKLLSFFSDNYFIKTSGRCLREMEMEITKLDCCCWSCLSQILIRTTLAMIFGIRFSCKRTKENVNLKGHLWQFQPVNQNTTFDHSLRILCMKFAFRSASMDPFSAYFTLLGFSEKCHEQKVPNIYDAIL